VMLSQVSASTSTKQAANALLKRRIDETAAGQRGLSI
jgi:hypothetical protein